MPHYFILIKNENNPKAKIILCSEFMEVLKNNKSRSEENKTKNMFNQITIRFSSLQIDTNKLFENLQKEIYYILINAKKTCNRQQDLDSNKVHNVWKKLNEIYVPSIIAFHRNNIIHAGKYGMNLKDRLSFVKYWNNKYDKNPSENQKKILDIMMNQIQNEFNNNHLFNVRNQSLFIEHVIEIILLKLLEVDCDLTKETRFLSKNMNWETTYNSKTYIEKFLK